MADVYVARRGIKYNAFPGKKFENFTVFRTDSGRGDYQSYTANKFEGGSWWILNEVSKQVIDKDGRIGRRVVKAVEELIAREDAEIAEMA